MRFDSLERYQQKETAATALKMHAEDLMPLGIVDAMIDEPLGGAHHDPDQVYKSVKKYILSQWKILKKIPVDSLLEERYQKFRKIGKFAQDKNP